MTTHLLSPPAPRTLGPKPLPGSRTQQLLVLEEDADTSLT